MAFVNYKWDKPVFAQAAIFKCHDCGHCCEVYSDSERVKPMKWECEGCNTPDSTVFYAGNRIFKCDCDADFEEDDAIPPGDGVLGHCLKCTAKAGIYEPPHWTELKVLCTECDRGDMYFEHFIEGTYMEAFLPIARERTKLIAPLVEFPLDDEDGIRITQEMIDEYEEQQKNNPVKVYGWEWGIRFSAT